MSHPYFTLALDGKSLSASIMARVLSWEIFSRADFMLDHITVVLDDRPPHIEEPQFGQELIVAIGYRETGLVEKGSFFIDEVIYGGNPEQTVTIVAKAHDNRKKLKGGINQSYHQKTIEEIVSEIAQRNGLQPMVDGKLGQKKIEHRDQTKQSDMSFLQTLATDYGAMFKIKDGKLSFAPWGATKSVSGEAITNTTLRRSECLTYDCLLHSRSAFKQTATDFRSLDNNEDNTENSQLTTPDNAPEGQGDFYDPPMAPTQDEAGARASSNSEALDRSQNTFEFVCVGKPELDSECFVTLEGFRPGIPTLWKIDDCRQVFGASGFHTQCKCVLPGDSSAAPAAWSASPSVDASAQDSSSEAPAGAL